MNNHGGRRKGAGRKSKAQVARRISEEATMGCTLREMLSKGAERERRLKSLPENIEFVRGALTSSLGHLREGMELDVFEKIKISLLIVLGVPKRVATACVEQGDAFDWHVITPSSCGHSKPMVVPPKPHRISPFALGDIPDVFKRKIEGDPFSPRSIFLEPEQSDVPQEEEHPRQPDVVLDPSDQSRNIMKLYLTAIVQKLQIAMNGTQHKNNRKLLNSLEANPMRKYTMSGANMLNAVQKGRYWIEPPDPTRYRVFDPRLWFISWVYLWLPGYNSLFRIECPNQHCRRKGQAAYVKGFEMHHPGRRVVGISGSFWVVSRRYKCPTCSSNVDVELDDSKKLFANFEKVHAGGMKIGADSGEDGFINDPPEACEVGDGKRRDNGTERVVGVKVSTTEGADSKVDEQAGSTLVSKPMRISSKAKSKLNSKSSRRVKSGPKSLSGRRRVRKFAHGSSGEDHGSFFAYDSSVVRALGHHGTQFPAYFTHKGGLSKGTNTRNHPVEIEEGNGDWFDEKPPKCTCPCQPCGNCQNPSFGGSDVPEVLGQLPSAHMNQAPHCNLGTSILDLSAPSSSRLSTIKDIITPYKKRKKTRRHHLLNKRCKECGCSKCASVLSGSFCAKGRKAISNCDATVQELEKYARSGDKGKRARRRKCTVCTRCGKSCFIRSSTKLKSTKAAQEVMTANEIEPACMETPESAPTQRESKNVESALPQISLLVPREHISPNIWKMKIKTLLGQFRGQGYPLPHPAYTNSMFYMPLISTAYLLATQKELKSWAEFESLLRLQDVTKDTIEEWLIVIANKLIDDGILPWLNDAYRSDTNISPSSPGHISGLNQDILLSRCRPVAQHIVLAIQRTYHPPRLLDLQIEEKTEAQAYVKEVMGKQKWVEGIQVKYQDFKRLRLRDQVVDDSEVHLNDRLMFFYLFVLTKEIQNAHVWRPRVTFFDTFFMEILLGKTLKRRPNFKDATRAYKRLLGKPHVLPIKKTDLLLFPINLRRMSHWVLIVVDTTKRCIYGLDPNAPDDGTPIVRHLKSKLQDFLVRAEDKSFQYYNIGDQKVPHSRQMNGYDCGPYVCYYMYCLSRGVPPTGRLSSELLRTKIALTLKRKKTAKFHKLSEGWISTQIHLVESRHKGTESRE